MNTSSRHLGPGDLDALLSLYAHLHKQDAPLAAERAKAVWKDICADANAYVTGVESAGRLVAACSINIVSNLTRGGRPYAVIENVVTHASHRRQSFGRQAMNAAFDVARAHDCYKVMLMSAGARSSAHDFYESLGFDRSAKQAFVLSLDSAQ